MDLFQHIGKVVGSLKALMVLKHDIPINQRQCCLLFDIMLLAFKTISEEIKQNLRLEERSTKWKSLEQPMRELHRIFKEGELYIKNCLEIKDWWGKAISLHQNKECVEFHIHNLLCCFPIVIEAIETAAEISGLDHDDMQRRRLVLLKKYDTEWNDAKLFQWKFGKQYLVPREITNRLENAWREDRWFLLESIRERRSKHSALIPLAKHEQRLGDLLLKKLNSVEPLNLKLLPSSILVGEKDYQVKRRLGCGTHCKEIHWLGENFALRTFFGEIEPLQDEISSVISLSHPNIMQYLCGFYDDEKRECLLVMELMNKSLWTYIKENCGQRKRVPFSIPVAVDIMLQIARGMEYLHSRKIFHGDLNPSNILLKTRNSEYFQAKVTGFGLTPIKSYISKSPPKQDGIDPVIWYAPEVLAEEENKKPGAKSLSKYSEKADVYSFGMLCFEILTGKVPFEEGHLQGDKMARNIRAGERPLFPHPSPKYLANLTRKCWQSNPIHRPSFSSICRILRYIKKILVINPDHGHPDLPPPLVDYCDIEAGYSKKFPGEGSLDLTPVTQIPFQMFAYKLVEKDKSSGSSKGKGWDLGPTANEHAAAMDDLFLAASDHRSVCSEILERKNSFLTIADQRSVISEIPHRKLFTADQRSVCSESPGRAFFSTGDQSPFNAENLEMRFAETPGRKFAETPDRKFTVPVTADGKSPFFDTIERKTLPADRKAPSLEIPEKKVLSTTSNNGLQTPLKKFPSTPTAQQQKSLKSSEIQEKQPMSTTAEQKTEIQENKPMSTKVDEKINETSHTENLSTATTTTADRKPILNPEAEEKRSRPMKLTKQTSVCAMIPEKKVVSIPATGERKLRSKSPEKKLLSAVKPRDTKTKKVPGTLERDSPRSSPTRPLKGYSSPRSSPTRAPKEFSSPRASPLNPCLRCSRTNRESLLPSGMSPSRHRRGHRETA